VALSFLGSGSKIEASSQVISGFKLTLPWKGMTGLHIAVYFRADAAVEILLKHGAHIYLEDARGRTPLSFAAAGGKLSTVRLLLENGASTASKDTSSKRTTLLSASESGNLEVVEMYHK
jgi:ankyrin repeat protein